MNNKVVTYPEVERMALILPSQKVIKWLNPTTRLWAIAVGMPVARHPPHRSVRAQLRHTAPTLGFDGEPVLWPRM